MKVENVFMFIYLLFGVHGLLASIGKYGSYTEEGKKDEINVKVRGDSNKPFRTYNSRKKSVDQNSHSSHQNCSLHQFHSKGYKLDQRRKRQRFMTVNLKRLVSKKQTFSQHESNTKKQRQLMTQQREVDNRLRNERSNQSHVILNEAAIIQAMKLTNKQRVRNERNKRGIIKSSNAADEKRKLHHVDSTYEEFRNISDLLEPLLKEIIKSSEHNKTLLNSSRLNHMRSLLDKYMDRLRSKTPPLNTFTPTTSPTNDLWAQHSTTSEGYILLGGEDDEGDDDTDAGLAGESNGSGIDGSGRTSVTEKPTEPTVLTKEPTFNPFVEQGFIVLVDDTASENPSRLPFLTKSKLITTATTTTTKTTLSKPASSTYDPKFLRIDYYGPCLFCHVREVLKVKRAKRRKMRDKLLNFDFVILAQKHPSGVYTAVLSLQEKKIEFLKYNYIKIHVPLSCGCFALSKNSRYILAGNKVAGKLTLNNLVPLYEINDYKEVHLIHQAMRIIT